LLKCTSAYPALPEEMNLRTMVDMAGRFEVVTGLSDHTMGHTVPVAAVALGACIIEKHFTLSRATPGPDSSFSMEPQEFRAMVDAIRTVEQALGVVKYEVSEAEAKSRVFRRSVFVVEDIAAGEVLTPRNVRCIRPGHGLHPREYDRVLGSRAVKAIARGTPLSFELIEGGAEAPSARVSC
jgi:sialic acid synthase SpsE